MATQQDGWNSVVGGLNDIIGIAGNVGNAVNAWKQTTPSVGSNTAPSNNSSLDNLAESLTASATANRKLLIIGGIGLATALGLFLVFRK